MNHIYHHSPLPPVTLPALSLREGLPVHVRLRGALERVATNGALRILEELVRILTPHGVEGADVVVVGGDLPAVLAGVAVGAHQRVQESFGIGSLEGGVVW